MMIVVFSGILLFFFYLPNFTEGYFPIDDDVLIGAPQVSANVNLLIKLKQIFTPAQHYDYYPIRDLSYIFDWLWGINLEVNLLPAKLQNLFWFLLCGLAIIKILIHLDVAREWAGLFTFIWLMHPYHAEMMLWVSARKDLMALAFALWGVYHILKFDALPLDSKNYRRKSITMATLSWLCFVCSGFSKASLLLFIPAYFFASVLLRKTPSRRPTVLLLAIISANNLFITLVQKWQYTAVNNMYYRYTFVFRIQAIITAFGKMMAGLIYFPANVVDNENWGEWVDLNKPYFYFGLILLMVIGGFSMFRLKQKNWWLGFALLAGLYATIPGVNIYHRNFYSTRYFEPVTVLLLIGLAYFVSRRLEFTILRKGGRLAILGCVFLSLIWMESSHWKTNQTILKKSVQSNPQQANIIFSLIYENLTLKRWNQLEKNDDEALIQQFDQLFAICSEAARSLNPNGSLCFRYWTTFWKDFRDRLPLIKTPTDEERRAFVARYNEEIGLLSDTEEKIPFDPSNKFRDLRAYKRFLHFKRLNLENSTPELRAFNLIQQCFEGGQSTSQQNYMRLQEQGLIKPIELMEVIEYATDPQENLLLRSCFFKKQ